MRHLRFVYLQLLLHRAQGDEVVQENKQKTVKCSLIAFRTERITEHDIYDEAWKEQISKLNRIISLKTRPLKTQSVFETENKWSVILKITLLDIYSDNE